MLWFYLNLFIKEMCVFTFEYLNIFLKWIFRKSAHSNVLPTKASPALELAFLTLYNSCWIRIATLSTPVSHAWLRTQRRHLTCG